MPRDLLQEAGVISQEQPKDLLAGSVDLNPKNEAIRQDYPVRRQIMNVARPVLEGVGMGAGGVLGTGAGPVGTVAGAGLGYGIGTTLSDLLENMMGIRHPTPYGASPVGVMDKAAKDVGAGMAMEMGGQIAGKLAAPIASKVLGPSPKITPEAQRAMDLANQQGVYLSPADVLQTKGLALAEQVMNNAPLSATIVQKKKLETIRGLTNYRNRLLAETGNEGTITDYLGRKAQMEIDDYINQLGLAKSANINQLRDSILQQLGSTQSYQELGKATQEQLKQSSRALFDKAGSAYQSFYRQLPEDTFIPTNKLTQTADRLLQEQLSLPEAARDNNLVRVLSSYGTKEVPPDVAQSVAGFSPEARQQALRAYGIEEGNSFDPRTIQAVRSDLYKKAMAEDSAMQMNQPGYKFTSNKAGGTYKQLRSALDEDIRTFAEQTGGEPWETYALANKIYSEGKQIYNKSEIIKAMKNNPERVTDVLIQPGNTTGVQFARKALGDGFFDSQLKPKLTSRLVDKATINGDFDPAIFKKQLDSYTPETLASVYHPAELAFLEDAATTGLRLKDVPLIDKYFPRLVRSLESRPSAVVKLIIQPKSIKSIQQAKAVLSPETWKDVEQTFLSDLMTVNKPIAGEATEFISPNKFETGLFKYRDEVLKAALSPENYQAIKELGVLSKYTQTAERIAGNPSGTAQNVIAWGQGAMIWHNPITGLGMALTPPAFAKLYFSPLGRKLFVEGFKTSAHIPKGVELGMKISALLERTNKKDQRFENSSIGGSEE